MRPTPVQYACIPVALEKEKRNIIACAKTGSGKSFAFVLPIINELNTDLNNTITALVLTPTRELAHQICESFKVFQSLRPFKVALVVGGHCRMRQLRELQQPPQVVVATPGRLYDLLLMENPQFSLSMIKYFVLDEADQLLHERFQEQLDHIIQFLPDPKKRQNLLFSATITDQISKMEKMTDREVFKWETPDGRKEQTVAQLQEQFLLVNPKLRDVALIVFLLKWRKENPNDLALVFIETRFQVEVLGLMMERLEIPCARLHGFTSPTERLAALREFKNSRIKLLLATDLASRGLDIPLVSLVINHTLPNDPVRYLHRVGRTARAGRQGLALSILAPEDQNILSVIEGVTKKAMEHVKSDENLIRRCMKEVLVTKRQMELQVEAKGFDEKKIQHERVALIQQGIDPDEHCAELRSRVAAGKETRRRRFLKGQSAGAVDAQSREQMERKIIDRSSKQKSKLKSSNKTESVKLKSGMVKKKKNTTKKKGKL